MIKDIRRSPENQTGVQSNKRNRSSWKTWSTGDFFCKLDKSTVCLDTTWQTLQASTSPHCLKCPRLTTDFNSQLKTCFTVCLWVFCFLFSLLLFTKSYRQMQGKEPTFVLMRTILMVPSNDRLQSCPLYILPQRGEATRFSSLTALASVVQVLLSNRNVQIPD